VPLQVLGVQFTPAAADNNHGLTIERNKMDPKRNLTEADVNAIVDALEERISKKFYLDIGQGVWSMAWKTIIVLIIGIAAYGATKGLK